MDRQLSFEIQYILLDPCCPEISSIKTALRYLTGIPNEGECIEVAEMSQQ